jgi:hypothetical protein
VDPQIIADVKNIAAAGSPTWDSSAAPPVVINFGDGSNALRLAQLKHSRSVVRWQLGILLMIIGFTLVSNPLGSRPRRQSGWWRTRAPS